MVDDNDSGFKRRGLLAAAGGSIATLAAVRIAAQDTGSTEISANPMLIATAEPYNCDPTGTRDCSAARDALITDAKDRDATIYWPTGVYRMSAFPDIDFNLRMIGDGIQTPPTNRLQWGLSMGSMSYAHRSSGTRIWISGPHKNTPQQKIALNVVDPSGSKQPGKEDGPILSGIGLFGPLGLHSTEWSELESWVGIALGKVSTEDKTSVGFPVRPRLLDVTIAAFGVGLGGSCSVGNFYQLHIVSCAVGVQGTYAFNGNTFVGVDIETCRDFAIRMVQCHSNVFIGGVTQNNVDMSLVRDYPDQGSIPAATRTRGAVVFLDDNCVGNVFMGIYMEDGYANYNGRTELRQVVLGEGSEVHGNRFEECRFGSYSAKNPVILMIQGGVNSITAYQGTYGTRILVDTCNILRGSFHSLAGRGVPSSEVENYRRGPAGWGRVDGSSKAGYVRVGSERYQCLASDDFVHLQSGTAATQGAVVMPDASEINPTWSVVVFNRNDAGLTRSVIAKGGHKINGVGAWNVPPNTSVEFFWDGEEWLAL
ncbi:MULTISPECIES: hypothetical protein [unclassified Luteococcus]|uniref:hypothetical protein n=1 Tax=unclassified Luteococcus TaxID=2639923 RepID=UPI00313C259F